MAVILSIDKSLESGDERMSSPTGDQRSFSVQFRRFTLIELLLIKEPRKYIETTYKGNK